MFAHNFNIFLVSDIMDYLLKIILQFITIVVLFEHLGDDGAVSFLCMSLILNLILVTKFAL